MKRISIFFFLILLLSPSAWGQNNAPRLIVDVILGGEQGNSTAYVIYKFKKNNGYILFPGRMLYGKKFMLQKKTYVTCRI
jgi:hypothetical protein